MSIVHITAPARIPSDEFGPAVTPPHVGGAPTPQLFTREKFAAPNGSVKVGIWEATPGRFARAVVDAEFSQFLTGHATFVTDNGTEYQFRAGDAAYFPPNTKGVWTIHEKLRKTYVLWR
jgi:uncharacterized cupin superfamily protein